MMIDIIIIPVFNQTLNQHHPKTFTSQGITASNQTEYCRIDGLEQAGGNSTANALELPQSRTKQLT